MELPNEKTSHLKKNLELVFSHEGAKVRVKSKPRVHLILMQCSSARTEDSSRKQDKIFLGQKEAL